MQTALDAAKRAKQDTVAYLIEEVHLSPSLLAETISAEFAEPYFDLDVYDTSQIPKDLVDQKLILNIEFCRSFKEGKFYMLRPVIQAISKRLMQFVLIVNCWLSL